MIHEEPSRRRLSKCPLVPAQGDRPLPRPPGPGEPGGGRAGTRPGAARPAASYSGPSHGVLRGGAMTGQDAGCVSLLALGGWPPCHEDARSPVQGTRWRPEAQGQHPDGTLLHVPGRPLTRPERDLVGCRPPQTERQRIMSASSNLCVSG